MTISRAIRHRQITTIQSAPEARVGKDKEDLTLVTAKTMTLTQKKPNTDMEF
jgi:hypothetical protein